MRRAQCQSDTSSNDARCIPRFERRAFTLLELLIVVAVVGVLLGLLLPSLARARESSRATQCASQIRQLLFGNDAYAADNAGLYAPAAPGIHTRNLLRWHGGRKSVSAAFNTDGGPLPRYISEEGARYSIRACPSFQPTLVTLAQRGRAFERGCGGYGYNQAFVGSQRRLAAGGAWIVETDLLGSAQTRFAGPSRTAAFGDAALAADELIEYSFLEPPKWPDSPQWRPDPSVHFRHSGAGAGIGWLDGHVSTERMSHSERSGVYRADPKALGIGWFGPVDRNELFDYE